LSLAFNRDHPPGGIALVTGRYRLIDVFGKETHIRITIVGGEALPSAPRGHGWRLIMETAKPGCGKLMLLRAMRRLRFRRWSVQEPH
jgi:hypothetical protein